jgi:hypothetical protein
MTKVKIAIVSDFYQEQILEFVDFFKAKASEFEFIYTGKNENFSFWNYFKTIYFVEGLDLSKYDLVVSLSSGIAHGIVTNLDTKHINFGLDSDFELFESNSVFLKIGLRNWHSVSLTRPDKNFCLAEFEKIIFDKRNRAADFKLAKIVKKHSLEKPFETDKFHLITNDLTDFSHEIVQIFNKTGKKLCIVTTEKVKNKLISNLNPEIEIQLINSYKIEASRGVILDKNFRSGFQLINLVQGNFWIFSNQNRIATDFFKNVNICESGESVEGQLSKFISKSKLELAKDNFKYQLNLDSFSF